MTDEQYFDAAVVAVLAAYRDLSPEEQKQFRVGIQTPDEAAGRLTRARAACVLYGKIASLLAGGTPAGKPPDKGRWHWVKRELGLKIEADSIRRAYQRYVRTLGRESVLSLREALVRLPLIEAE